jgi:hypothetical protein
MERVPPTGVFEGKRKRKGEKEVVSQRQGSRRRNMEREREHRC